MDYAKFTELQNDEFEFLDTINVKKYLKDGAEISDVMNTIEEIHGKDYYEHFIFNCIDRDDFMRYIEKRYNNISFNESINYYVRFIEE